MRSLDILITFKRLFFGYASKKLFSSGCRVDDNRTEGSDVTLPKFDEILRRED